MNKKDRQIKRLAEEHVLCGRILNENEIQILRNSKYAKLVNVSPLKTKFDTITESILTGTSRSNDGYNFHGHLNKPAVRELVDEIEETFNLGVDAGYGKYKRVSSQELQQFINSYIEREILDRDTKSFLQKLTHGEQSTQEILYSLFSCCK